MQRVIPSGESNLGFGVGSRDVRGPAGRVDHEEFVEVVVDGPVGGGENMALAEAEEVLLVDGSDVDAVCRSDMISVTSSAKGFHLRREAGNVP
jgi:septum formation inhibitor-activating ATPase MinD